MGFRLNLPDAGLLGIAGVRYESFPTQPGATPITQTLATNYIYVVTTGESDSSLAHDFIFTLPSAARGDVIVLKNLSTAKIQIASALIESTTQTVEITNNIPVRFTFTGDPLVGWVLL